MSCPPQVQADHPTEMSETALADVDKSLDRGGHLRDDFDGTKLVEREVPSPVHNAHATHPNPIQNLVLVPNNHAGLEFTGILQPSLILWACIVLSGIGFVT